MNQNQVVFVIDAGNTSLKIGRFQAGVLEKVSRFGLNELDLIKNELAEDKSASVFVSSVLSENDTKLLMENCPGSMLLDRSVSLPIRVLYESPQTLGIDRICNAVAVHELSPNRAVVSIDIGTCIKFDLVDAEGNYWGGSIAPGIDLRYRSMNDYTGKLPLIDDKQVPDLVGKNTLDSMRSGVMNGMKAEIIQMMEMYTQKFGQLTFFMTGGDAVYFDFPLKNNIFVNENLTLLGLYKIYMFNA